MNTGPKRPTFCDGIRIYHPLHAGTWRVLSREIVCPGRMASTAPCAPKRRASFPGIRLIRTAARIPHPLYISNHRLSSVDDTSNREGTRRTRRARLYDKEKEELTSQEWEARRRRSSRCSSLFAVSPNRRRSTFPKRRFFRYVFVGHTRTSGRGALSIVSCAFRAHPRD